MNDRTVQKEVEVKLELPSASLRALKTVPLFKTPPRHTREVSVYFDTDKHKLRKNGLMLRVRRIGNRYVQTIKATGSSGPFERDEWEVELPGQEPDLRMAEGTALERLANDKLRRQLKPLFETRVHRSVYSIADDRCAIALTVDRGSIETGNHSMPLCEIELEMLRGKLADLFDVARELTRTLPTRIAFKSKSQRGYELIDGMQYAPLRGKAIDLPSNAITRDAFKIIGNACLDQIIGNEPAVLRDDPEGVHQMRVGLRRLRAGMSVFSGLLRDPQTAAIRSELKWLAAELVRSRSSLRHGFRLGGGPCRRTISSATAVTSRLRLSLPSS
jgi:triphosphatase